jgi:predicted TIM-barrel fold metal-dependent hydrolase
LSEATTITFEQVHQGIKKNIENAYFDFAERTMKWVKAYGILTVVSGIFDFFNLVIILHHFGEQGAEYEEMTLLGLCMVFWGCNLYWAGYVFLTYYRFPNYMAKYLQEMFFGVGVLIDKKLKNI